MRLPRCRRALVWLVSFLFVFNTIPTSVFADVIVNNDPQQNTTSENLSNESADSDSGSRGGVPIVLSTGKCSPCDRIAAC